MARLGRVGPGMVQDPEVEWKILALGEGGVGKSSFLIQFVDSVFIDEDDPPIEDSFRRNVCFLFDFFCSDFCFCSFLGLFLF